MTRRTEDHKVIYGGEARPRGQWFDVMDVEHVLRLTSRHALVAHGLISATLARAGAEGSSVLLQFLASVEFARDLTPNDFVVEVTHQQLSHGSRCLQPDDIKRYPRNEKNDKLGDMSGATPVPISRYLPETRAAEHAAAPRARNRIALRIRGDKGRARCIRRRKLRLPSRFGARG